MKAKVSSVAKSVAILAGLAVAWAALVQHAKFPTGIDQIYAFVTQSSSHDVIVVILQAVAAVVILYCAATVTLAFVANVARSAILARGVIRVTPRFARGVIAGLVVVASSSSATAFATEIPRNDGTILPPGAVASQQATHATTNSESVLPGASEGIVPTPPTSQVPEGTSSEAFSPAPTGVHLAGSEQPTGLEITGTHITAGAVPKGNIEIAKVSLSGLDVVTTTLPSLANGIAPNMTLPVGEAIPTPAGNASDPLDPEVRAQFVVGTDAVGSQMDISKAMLPAIARPPETTAPLIATGIQRPQQLIVERWVAHTVTNHETIWSIVQASATEQGQFRLSEAFKATVERGRVAGTIGQDPSKVSPGTTIEVPIWTRT